MSQTAITKAFEPWLVDKTVNAMPARPDKMVFAMIPGQNENAEIDRLEGMPKPEQIRYTTAITQYGALNNNAVVYSVVLDTTIGTWNYNWVGLIDSVTNTVLMIVHLAEQQKIKTANGQQGNSLIRNLAMEFDGAATASQITVTPATWMIDFSARLHSMDEVRRLANVDYYGDQAFRGDGFKVTLSGGIATVAAGLGYVSGLRAMMSQNQAVTMAGKTGVWVDIVWQGTVTGAWSNAFTLKAADTLTNYVDSAGYQHYVTQIAKITGSVVTDMRQPFPLDALGQKVDGLDVYTKSQSDGRYLQKNNNLSEIKSAGAQAQADARANLDIKSSSQITDEIKKNCQYLVGDVLFRGNNNNPSTDWPGTAWLDLNANYSGRSIAIGGVALATGGSNSVTLTTGNLPPHNHTFSGTTDGAGAHAHTYDRYQENGTINPSNFSINNVKHGNVSTLTSSDGAHSHNVSGTIGSTGGGQAFSIIDPFVILRAWMRMS